MKCIAFVYKHGWLLTAIRGGWKFSVRKFGWFGILSVLLFFVVDDVFVSLFLFLFPFPFSCSFSFLLLQTPQHLKKGLCHPQIMYGQWATWQILWQAPAFVPVPATGPVAAPSPVNGPFRCSSPFDGPSCCSNSVDRLCGCSNTCDRLCRHFCLCDKSHRSTREATSTSATWPSIQEGKKIAAKFSLFSKERNS